MIAARKVTVTSTDYRHPHRPLPVSLLNHAGRLAERVGAWPELDVDKLVAGARRKAGLSDFGDPWFLTPLGVLVDSINAEANLTPLGKLIQKTRLEAALVTRLRVEALLARHPEIHTIDLGKVLVIAGLQRTGTTTLHRLIAADPDMRALLSWEALNPIPLPDELPGRPTRRIGEAKTAERGLAYLAPEFFAIHPVEHDAPEEDVLLLDLSFMSQTAEAILHVPSYARWLERQDHTRAYAYLRTLLQVLSWQRRAPNWVLKTPHHMEHLDTLLSVFPGAFIVQTHRDPQKTTGSFCSMVAHGRGVFSDVVDPEEVGRHWLRKVRRLMARSIEVRDTSASDRFLDVSYYDLVKDPVGELRRVYAFAGIPLDETTAQAALDVSRANKQHRYGRHIYDLSAFNLTRQRVEAEYRFYRERYAIPFE